MTAVRADSPTGPLENVLKIDRALTEIERDIDLLLNITPVNSAEAWSDFAKSGFSRVPTLQSRPVNFEPALVQRRLFNLEIEDVEDPSLAVILTQKRDELNRQVMLLEDRDTSRFLYGSLQLFGEVGSDLVDTAEELLSTVEVAISEDVRVTATAFAKRAEDELNLYRDRYPNLAAELEIRSDVPDLMVSHGRLLIGAEASFRKGRVEALIQHEVGTHVVTYENGSHQPLKLLAVGLPDYEETQEGLAVLAEFISGGLDSQRLRLLAGRVVAVNLLLEGAEFLDIFETLRGRHGFPPKVAWSVTIRVARSGGLTKDVIYLRGIARLLEFASQRKRLDPLFLGKMSLDHVPLIEELLGRSVLHPAMITPRWLDLPRAAERLERVYEGMDVLELIKPQ
ncbi:MAG: flavohemoglobin expression-modulating QEGLA motif protein [Actinomycetota bacterium]|nr:flavohemoglobin expression-modulating QEGLA motif protein [Actinomycetota bacterium]